LKSARDFKRKIEAERQEGLAGLNRGRHTLSEAISDYRATNDFRKRKSKRDTARHLAWWDDRIGRLPLSRVTPELIADNLHQLEASGVSGSTVNRYRSALSRIFRYAVNTRRWVDQNPCQMVEPREEGGARERIISPAEWRNLLDAARALNDPSNPYSPKSQLRNFLLLAYETAARKNDIRNLRWEYVDLEVGSLTFHEPKTGVGYSLPIVESLRGVLREQLDLSREACPWVFPSPNGNDNPAWFDGAFRIARKNSELDKPNAKGERVVFHSIRHTAATEAGLGGASAFEVQAMTGHKTLAMVQRYTKVGQNNALAAMKKRKAT